MKGQSNSGNIANSSASSRASSQLLPPDMDTHPDKKLLDSIAILAEGDNVCASVALIKGEIVIATNDTVRTSKKKKSSDEAKPATGKESKLIAQLRTYLTEAAREVRTIPVEAKTPQACEAFLSKFYEHQTSLEDTYSKIKTDPENRLLFQTELFSKNIFRTIFYADTIPGRSLSASMLDGLAEGKICFIEKTKKRHKMHAEMKIVDAMIQQNVIASDMDQQYIGISKKCCANCQAVMTGANTHIKDKNGDDALAGRTFDGHGQIYPSTSAIFLKDNYVTSNEFFKSKKDSIRGTVLSLAQEQNTQRLSTALEINKERVEQSSIDISAVWPSTLAEMYAPKERTNINPIRPSLVRQVSEQTPYEDMLADYISTTHLQQPPHFSAEDKSKMSDDEILPPPAPRDLASPRGVNVIPSPKHNRKHPSLNPEIASTSPSSDKEKDMPAPMPEAPHSHALDNTPPPGKVNSASPVKSYLEAAKITTSQHVDTEKTSLPSPDRSSAGTGHTKLTKTPHIATNATTSPRLNVDSTSSPHFKKSKESSFSNAGTERPTNSVSKARDVGYSVSQGKKLSHKLKGKTFQEKITRQPSTFTLTI